MAETGIEDIIRGEGRGCAGSFIAPIIGFLVFFLVVGLLVSYCAPSGTDNPPETNTQDKR